MQSAKRQPDDSGRWTGKRTIQAIEWRRLAVRSNNNRTTIRNK